MPHQDFQPVALPALLDKHETPQLSPRGQSYEKLPKYSDLSADINTRIWPLRVPAGPGQWECARRGEATIVLGLGFALVLLRYFCQTETRCSAPTGRASLSLRWVLGLPLIPGNQGGRWAYPIPSAGSGVPAGPGAGTAADSSPRGPSFPSEGRTSSPHADLGGWALEQPGALGAERDPGENGEFHVNVVCIISII